MQKKKHVEKIIIYLGVGGRITLIKVAMSNVPVYYMSLFKMPIKIIKTLEKLQLDFLWEGGNVKKDHFMKWMLFVSRKSWSGWVLVALKKET